MGYRVYQTDGKVKEWLRNPMPKKEAVAFANKARKELRGTGIRVYVKKV